MLVAYSADNNFNSLAKYFMWYPGDKYFYIMGMDNYGDLRSKNDVKKLHIVIEASKFKNNYVALTETALENIALSHGLRRV